MSAEDDLKKYQRDQDLFFQDLADLQQREQRAVEASEFAAALKDSVLKLERIDRLRPGLLKLGRQAGMSDAQAEYWANSLIKEGKRRLINAKD
jgi:hypothetical protein